MLKIQPIPEAWTPKLFDVEQTGRIKSAGQCRTSCGSRIEHFVCTALNLIPIPLSGKYDVNFDAGHVKNGRSVYVEIKSLRRGNKSPLFKFRLEKELRAQTESGIPVVYVFCVHRLKGVKSQEEITRTLLYFPVSLYLITLDEVAEMCKDLPLRKMKTSGGQHGYNRVGYKDGYTNLPYVEIAMICGSVYSAPKLHFNIFDKKTCVSVFRSPLAVDLI